VPTLGNKVGKVKSSNFLGEPNDGKIRTDTQILHVSLEHALNENWKLRLAGQYLHGDLDGAATEFIGSANVNTGTINRYWRLRDDFNAQDMAVHAELLGKFELLGWQHQVLAGVEYENYHNRYRILYSDPANLYPINIHNPIYDQPKPPLTGRQTYDREYTKNHAINLADQIEFNDKWQALLGVRIEHFEQTIVGDAIGPVAGGSVPSSSKRSQNKDVVVPRAGVVYKWLPEVSLFASVGSSFKPNGSDGEGGMLKPEKGLGYESGAKFDLFDSRLGATLAAFYIEKENVSQQDPSDPMRIRRVAAGKVRSQGVDLQFSGQLAENLRVIGAYAFIDAEISKDNRPGYKGARLDNSPRHSGSLMTVYQLAQGTDVGAAVTRVGERLTSAGGNPVKMPAYTTLDLLGHWQATEQLNLGLNLNNLLNKKYAERSFGSSSYLPGEPRNLNLSATFSF